MSDDRHYSLETLAVRAGQERSQFGEHAEALYLTSSFVFENAAQAAARFSGAEPGNVYSRFTNPTVTMLQDRLAALEGAEACVATASGMSAILATVMALLNAGDHIVAARGIFGATQQLFARVAQQAQRATTDSVNLQRVRCYQQQNVAGMIQQQRIKQGTHPGFFSGLDLPSKK